MPVSGRKRQVAGKIRRLADQMESDHPEMGIHAHLRDAAGVLDRGVTHGAIRHLQTAAHALTPQSLYRHGMVTDDAHTAARRHMHDVTRQILLIKDIQDIETENNSRSERHAARTGGSQPPGNQAMNAPARGNSGGPGNAAEGPRQPEPQHHLGAALASGPQPYHRGPDETVTCPYCGKGDAPDARFCDQCGRRLPDSAFIHLATELAFNPMQPRNQRGRWTHVPAAMDTPDMRLAIAAGLGPAALKQNQARTPLQRMMADFDRTDRQKERESGLWGGRTAAEHEAALRRLTPEQHQRYVQNVIKGLKPGDALASTHLQAGWTFEGKAGGTDHIRQIMRLADQVQPFSDSAAASLRNAGRSVATRDMAAARVHMTDALRYSRGTGIAASIGQAAASLAQVPRGAVPLERGTGMAPASLRARKSSGYNPRLGQQPPSSGHLPASAAGINEFSNRTGMLSVTPAPRGKPGGPGLYNVKGNEHSPYLQQVAKALIEKRGMPPGKAYAIATAALKRWRRGGGHVHPEVQAAAGGALGLERAAAARARGHSHTLSPEDERWAAIDLAIELASRNGRHIPGTPYTYRHGWQPLSPTAETGHPAAQIKRIQARGRGTKGVAVVTPAGQTGQVAEIAAREARVAAAHYTSKLQNRQETVEKRVIARRTAIHIGVLAAGAVLAYLEQHFHVGEALAGLTAAGPYIMAKLVEIGPEVVNEITDWAKKL